MNWLQSLRSRLITRFSINQKIISAAEVASLDRKAYTPQFLIGRDLSRYALIELGHVTRANRVQALTHQIKLLSPWDDTDFSVAWSDGAAQVWFWSRKEIHDLLGSAITAKSLYRPDFFSEVLFWERPAEDGIYLYKANTGFDLQLWRSGILRGSQWFNHEPSKQQIQRFSRSNGAAPDIENLTVKLPNFSVGPWQGTTSSVWIHLVDRRTQIIAVGLAVSFLIATAQMTLVARWYWESANWDRKTAQLAESVEPLLSARSQARAARQELEQIQQILQPFPALASQIAVQKALPSALTIELQTWERNIDQVDISAKGQIADTLSVVRSLESAGFKEVRVEPTAINGQYRIRLRLSHEGISGLDSERSL